MQSMSERTLAGILREARHDRAMSLRDVERATGISNAHLSQLETGTIERPDVALLWDLATLYDLEFDELAVLAGHIKGPGRRRISVALRALDGLTDEEHDQALRYIAELTRRRRA
jgi:transcriptional regulator with XRE-family HTH domain